jgi:serine/threonine protein kinase
MSIPKTLGSWRLGELIGNGGQGDVYKAISGEGQPVVAIKVIKTSKPKRRARFLFEVRAHAALSKAGASNVMPILDQNLEEVEDGAVHGYIVMPLAVTSLEQQLELITGRVELSLEIFVGILRGVESAHSREIVHRDLKPDNILFLDTSLREPLVSDFGICLLRETTSADRVTEPTETVGARWFMAPEQEKGGIADVTVSADIYSLGKLLFYMLTGRFIYRERVETDGFSNQELARDHRVVRIRDEVLKRVVLEEPSERIQSVAELRAIVESIRGDTGGPEPGAPPPGPPVMPQTSERQPEIGEVIRAIRQELAEGQSKQIKLRFVHARETFDETWAGLRPKGATLDPRLGRQLVKALLSTQQEAYALDIASAQMDDVSSFPAFKSLVEHITSATKDDPGLPQITSVPNVMAGFLYMTAAVNALHANSWAFLSRLLTDEFRFYYRSERPLFAPGFGMSYFFHSEAMNRSASSTHDLFRERLASIGMETMTDLKSDTLLTAYIETQFLMSLRAAQINQAGGVIRMWADFGRFLDSRVTPLLERIYHDREFGEGVLQGFHETREAWFAQLNGRLAYIAENFWGSGSGYFWESVRSWTPR